MKIKELKILLDFLPEEAEVVVPDDDHSYRIADICTGTYALYRYKNKKFLTEDYEEKNEKENLVGTFRALIIS